MKNKKTDDDPPLSPIPPSPDVLWEDTTFCDRSLPPFHPELQNTSQDER